MMKQDQCKVGMTWGKIRFNGGPWKNKIKDIRPWPHCIEVPLKVREVMNVFAVGSVDPVHCPGRIPTGMYKLRLFTAQDFHLTSNTLCWYEYDWQGEGA